MEIMEIMSDALVYPINNIKALAVYIVLGIIAGVCAAGTIAGFFAGVTLNNIFAGGIGAFGLLLTILIVLLIAGYELDIIKYGIERKPNAPNIDVARQIVNACKVVVVDVVYYIIPLIISAIIGFVLGKGIIPTIIVMLISIIFSITAYMSKCRLAKTENLSDGLAIGEALRDISRVGIVKIVAVVALSTIIMVIILAIITAILNWNTTIGGILMGVFFVYLAFFTNRAVGLLYSDV